MTRIEFDCDRCRKHVSGLHTESGTAGFYVVDRGLAWVIYQQPRPEEFVGNDEHFVCDECVRAMPEYQAVYGSVEPGRTHGR